MKRLSKHNLRVDKPSTKCGKEEDTMRQLLVLAAALLCMSFATETFSQSSNATLNGTVSITKA
jgi:hypothetical protein